MVARRRFSTIHPTTGEYETFGEFEAASDAYRAWVRSGMEEKPPRMAHTFLDLIVDERDKIVLRGRRRVSFAHHHIPWRFFLCMWVRTTGYVRSSELIHAGWDGLTEVASETNVYYHISVLRRLLEPLKITVVNARGLGYRFEKTHKK